MEEKKTKKNKYTVGYKKLKNVQMFEEFSHVDERNSTWGAELESLWADLNTLYSLQDEGYLNDNGSLKVDPSDAIDFTRDELGQDNSEIWSTEEKFDAWVKGVMKDAKDFGTKYY